MRTTIDLDPDVDARLRGLARERGVPLRVVINDALRAGTGSERSAPEPYVLPTQRLGVRSGVDLDKALRLAGELEDDELLRKLELRGNLTTDAHLAALAIEHGAELNSCDADFSRFAGLRWADPLRDAIRA